MAFSQHNLLKNPPFSRIDLLTCRNVLIHFNDQAQRYAISLFHFAQMKGGVAWLGPSETLGEFAEEFKVVNQKWRIFAKAREAGPLGHCMVARGGLKTFGRPNGDVVKTVVRQVVAASGRDITRATSGVMKELLARCAPAGFLLSRDGALLHVFGGATKYMLLKPGAFS